MQHDRAAIRRNGGIAHFLPSRPKAGRPCWPILPGVLLLLRRYLSNRRSDLFEYGLVSRLVVDVVRGANGPLSTFEILARVTNGLESPPSSEGSRILYGRLRSAIANKVRQGIFRAQRSRGRFMTFEFIGYPIPYPIIPDYKTHGRGEQRPRRPLSELKLV